MAMDIRQLFGQVAGKALDVLVPPQCPLCDAIVAAQGGFCADCLKTLRFIAEPCCDQCAMPFDHLLPIKICEQCALASPRFARARAALMYDAGSRGLILGLKYGNRMETAATLAPLMARAGAPLLAQTDLVVPVPLHPRRLRTRGYNQAVLLARALTSRTGHRMLPDALRRLVDTPPLADLSAEARARTVATAFAVRPRHLGAVRGARVLLVDDVLTSGATANACADALIAAGAAAVFVLAAARAGHGPEE